MKIIPSPLKTESINSDDELKSYSDKMFDTVTPLQSNDKKVIEVYIQRINECFAGAQKNDLAFVSALFSDKTFLYYCGKDIRLQHLEIFGKLALLNPSDGLCMMQNLKSLNEYEHIYMMLYFLFRRIQLGVLNAEYICSDYVLDRKIPIIFVALVLAECRVGNKTDVLFRLADNYSAIGKEADAMMLLALSSKLITGAEEEILAKLHSLGR